MKTLSLICSILVVATPLSVAHRPVNPPSKDDIVGVWIGYAREYPYFYRLTLEADNTGSLVVMFLYPGARASVYDVNWELADAVLLLQAAPRDKASEQITCTVRRLKRDKMDLIVGGGANSWERTGLLLNEKRLSQRIAESAEVE